MTTWYSSGYPDPAASPQQAIIENDRSRLRCTPSMLTLPAAMLINEIAYLGRVRSNCKFSVNSRFAFNDLGTVGTLSVGLRHSAMTSAQITAAKAVLLSGQVVTTAGAVSLITDVAVVDRNKRAWELALMTKDPGGEFDIVMTAIAATDVAGSIFVEIQTFHD